MADPILIAKHGDIETFILPGLANRHGLITGATGTGKTVTLQKLAESFANIGVPVFVADIKGDLSGIGAAGNQSDKLMQRLAVIGITEYTPRANTVVFWDVFGEQGHPVRATISDMGPLLIARLLNLNDTQTGVLTLVFKIADDNGMLLLDLKDLRAMVQYVGENAKTFTTEYGNISTASIGAIQRNLLFQPEQVALDGADGRGVINVLAADKLYHSPKLYSTFLLWMLSELFEQLPEIGDPDKPKMVFFFDEAHLLFNDAPKALIEKIEQVVRLIRSKGVGVYFVTQVPTDIPDSVLAQLGNRVQHALRAFTPKDQKAVKATAQTMRPNPALNIEAAITELAVGEALVSFLDEKGRPSVTQRAYVAPPGSQIGPIADAQRQALLNNSLVAGVYETPLDRESAFEILRDRANAAAQQSAQAQEASSGLGGVLNDFLFGSTGPRGGKKDGLLQSVAKSQARSIANKAAGQLLRGVLGSLLGGKK